MDSDELREEMEWYQELWETRAARLEGNDIALEEQSKAHRALGSVVYLLGLCHQLRSQYHAARTCFRASSEHLLASIQMRHDQLGMETWLHQPNHNKECLYATVLSDCDEQMEQAVIQARQLQNRYFEDYQGFKAEYYRALTVASLIDSDLSTREMASKLETHAYHSREDIDKGFAQAATGVATADRSEVIAALNRMLAEHHRKYVYGNPQSVRDYVCSEAFVTVRLAISYGLELAPEEIADKYIEYVPFS